MSGLCCQPRLSESDYHQSTCDDGGRCCGTCQYYSELYGHWVCQRNRQEVEGHGCCAYYEYNQNLMVSDLEREYCRTKSIPGRHR